MVRTSFIFSTSGIPKHKFFLTKGPSYRMKNTAKKLLSGNLYPILLLFLMLCTFAIQLPHYGYYLDDWVFSTAYDQGGEKALIDYGIDETRPFYTWCSAKLFSLLGMSILKWQIFSLSCRFAAAILSWLILRKIWSDQKISAALISALFGIFPYFKHQAMAIAYHMVLLQYAIILLSFLLMILAFQSHSKIAKTVFWILSWLTCAFHMFAIEYYVSLEAVRILILWLIIKKQDSSIDKKKILLKIVKFELPYCLIFIAYFFYRFKILPSEIRDLRPIEILTTYKGYHLVLYLFSALIQYLTESSIGIWYRSIFPSELDFNSHYTQLAALLALICGTVVFCLLHSAEKNDKSNTEKDNTEMLILGIAAALFGFIPGMALNVSPASTNYYHDRYLIPSFWGISIAAISFIRLTFREIRLQDIFIALTICISVFFQIQNSNMYRYSWKYQQKYQWQMKWRIPDIKENTAIMGDGVIASFMGGWADGSMILEMYGKKTGVNPTAYWYFDTGDESYLSQLENGNSLNMKIKIYNFSASSSDALILTKPEYGKCVWLLTEADEANPWLEGNIRSYIPYQNKSRIIYDSNYQMPTDVFGKNGTVDWCYYFEKADLALDENKYDEALQLLEDAQKHGFSAGNPTEMRPFIQAAAFSGNWQKAADLTIQANENPYKDKSTPYFINLWNLLDRDTSASNEKSAAKELVLSKLNNK